MLLPSATDKFRPFLNESNLDLPTHEMGLLPNAPKEAVEQYEEYKKMMIEAIKNDIDL